uniref:Uncharacterized protein n=1 Tax=Neolamprologus brichardi TaxID=32507 RepID=A0A3Q4FXN3_NEOBR
RPAEKKVVKITPPLSASERLQKRAERFNLPASSESLNYFFFQNNSRITVLAVNVDQLKKRAERFGMNVSSISQKIEEDEKLKKRKERFGALTSAGSVGGDDVEVRFWFCVIHISSQCHVI